MIIVLAKVEMTGLRKTGRIVRRDCNYFEEFEAAPEPKACIWLLSGTSQDVETARQAMPDRILYTFPEWEPDPLGKAKNMVMAGDPGL